MFRFEADDGKPTNIYLEKLYVQGYVRGAFAFIGDRENPENGWNSHNKIMDCSLNNIGNFGYSDYEMCYGSIVFVNSKYNCVTNCSFKYLSNDEYVPGGTHDIIGVYISHYSDFNLVSECRSYQVKGNLVRIRDFSNENIIINNVFNKTGRDGVIGMWFCFVPSGFDPCTKDLCECPSWENVFENNICNGNWLGEKPLVFNDMVPISGDWRECNCTASVPPEYQNRINLANNIVTEYIGNIENGKNN